MDDAKLRKREKNNIFLAEKLEDRKSLATSKNIKLINLTDSFKVKDESFISSIGMRVAI